MSKLSDAFTHGKAFIPFLTGGDPNLTVSEELMIAMEEAGADLIEIGIPFSDPIAEGIVIQEANERALRAGCTTDRLFEMVERVRKKVQIPLVFLTYMNPIYIYGKERFFNRCKDVGIDGLIVPDLPFEEKGELTCYSETTGVELISLIAPTSKERIRKIAREAKGFVYCVSSLGVTGVRTEITTDIGAMVRLVKEETQIPVAVGFGISTPEQAASMAALSDGAIVGSAIVKLIAAHGKDSVGVVKEYVQEMKEAVAGRNNRK